MNALSEARAAYSSGDYLWQHPLIGALEAKREGLALEWITCCVRDLLPLVETSELESLLSDIAALRDYQDRAASWEEFGERSRQIWYTPPGRDAARTAVAKLYEAYANRPHK